MQPVVAAAYRGVGFLRMILKEPGAEEALRQSVALYQRLLALSPHDHDLRSALL
jgi:hypothetical protein